LLRILLLAALLWVCDTSYGQAVPDSTSPARVDSLRQDSTVVKDTVRVGTVPAAADSAWVRDLMRPPAELVRKAFTNHPYFGFGAPLAEKPVSNLHVFHGKEGLFYLLIAILMVFAILKLMFPKYFDDLFRLFFRRTLKQRQIKEQMLQTPLPSVLLNIFFVFSTGLYGAFLVQYFHVDPTGNFWILSGYCCALLAAVYLLKYIGLKLTGWLFNMNEAAEAYVFVVFLINKMIGIFLLPFLVVIAFADSNMYLVAMTASWCIVIGLLVYRFILTYSAVRNQVRVNIFHFFLYLCAFEIAPLLLIYKALLLFFNISP
jgi:hypothetical protein